MSQFSHRSRAQALARFNHEIFDLLIVGGGITGAAAARDAASRGLKVALVERRDFAWGTSSRSSKLVHGGLRYLENMEFKLVFEALSERANLLKTVPHMVRPLKFYFPVFKGDAHGRGILSLGMWLYDILAIFRTPGVHKSLSRKKLIQDIPFLNSDGLVGGFSYYDASMWDDVLAVQILRSAQEMGAAVANYVEAVSPIYADTEGSPRVTGFVLQDREKPESERIEIRAHQTIVCAGPWTDIVGTKVSPRWHTWLMPSKGVHLVFDHKRVPVPGALVMSHPEDGRIAFVIPRPDYGAGVTIVGTTDGPTTPKPEDAAIDPQDVQYIMRLLDRYFPELKLGTQDIVSAYVGVRPLMAPHAADQTGDEALNEASGGKPSLQKVSREHHIGEGPGGTVVVAGGKYTTHRTMAEEIIDFAVKIWARDFKLGKLSVQLPALRAPKTKAPVNPLATPEMMEKTFAKIPERELVERYGGEAEDVKNIAQNSGGTSDQKNPDGYPLLAAQLRHTMRTEMVLHLEDFYLRRVALYLSRADHGLPWARELSQVWAEELGLGEAEAARELEQLESELARRSAWKKGL
jgi:glycerol-3-phosphate dehydrogenase